MASKNIFRKIVLVIFTFTPLIAFYCYIAYSTFLDPYSISSSEAEKVSKLTSEEFDTIANEEIEDDYFHDNLFIKKFLNHLLKNIVEHEKLEYIKDYIKNKDVPKDLIFIRCFLRIVTDLLLKKKPKYTLYQRKLIKETDPRKYNLDSINSESNFIKAQMMLEYYIKVDIKTIALLCGSDVIIPYFELDNFTAQTFDLSKIKF